MQTPPFWLAGHKSYARADALISATVTVSSSIRNTFKLGHMSAANHTGDISFAVPAPPFELHIIKPDAEAIGSNLADAPVIIKIDIAIACAPCGTIDFGPASTNSIAAQPTFLKAGLTPLIQAITSLGATAIAVIIVIDLNHQTCICATTSVNLGDRIGHCRGDGEC